MAVYHAGEIAVQRRMRQQQIADRVGRMVRAEIPTAAADFLVQQPMVVVSAVDGRPIEMMAELTVYLETQTAIGETVDLTINRSGTVLTLSVPVAEQPTAD